ncbi:hypothetical protein [Aliamphritea spongicola]|uniref:hypothetical protein n=1 Tax=Aliamphritea spongicola TaxID=707589 RepID=UPI00196A26E9|nr:hypothetical protein [Aliamphritea spongicola]MBN3561401.1 hypothetical protein [Aliamphritea spongicola]
MYIQQSAVVQPAVPSAPHTSTVANSHNQAATSGQSETVSVSAQAREISASQAVYTMETGAGRKDVDLDRFFNPGSHLKDGVLDTGALLMPNAENVKALQQHISQRFPDFLAANNIPEPPAKIEYDSQGQIVLPADYPYAEQLKEALGQDEEMSRMLSTVNGLSSHLAALQSLQPMHDELDAATSQAEIDSILQRFSHLLNDNARYPEVGLSFSPDGQLQMTTESRPLV